MSHALATGRLGCMAWTSGKKIGSVVRYTAGLVSTAGAGSSGGGDPVFTLPCWSLGASLKKSLEQLAHQPHVPPRGLPDSPWELIRIGPDSDD